MLARRPAIAHLCLCGLVLLSTGGVSAAAGPDVWSGQASGNHLLWLPDFDGEPISRSGSFTREVRADGGELRISSPDGLPDWVATLEPTGTGSRSAVARKGRGSRRDGWTRLRATLDGVSHDALAEHIEGLLPGSIMLAPEREGDLDVMVVRCDMRLAVSSDAGPFTLSGSVHFRMGGADGGRAKLGLYFFGLNGEAQAFDPIDVLLLGDGRSQFALEGALLDAGYRVTTVAHYADWDGARPDAAKFDVVLYLDGFDHGRGLSPRADVALADFVADGGGLIRTEWSLWSGVVNPRTDPLLPVVYRGSYRYGATWLPAIADHPMVQGLPASWDDPAGYTFAAAVPGATVVIGTPDGWPLLTYGSAAGGTVVHVNHSLTYDGVELDPNLVRLFVNATAFAARR